MLTFKKALPFQFSSTPSRFDWNGKRVNLALFGQTGLVNKGRGSITPTYSSPAAASRYTQGPSHIVGDVAGAGTAGYISLGTAGDAQLSTSSGYFLAARTATNTTDVSTVYTTSIDGGGGNGTNGLRVNLVRTGKSVALTLDKANAVGIASLPGGPDIPGALLCGAWSYNSTSGLCVLALNGTSTRVVSAQTLTHSTCAIGRFRTNSSIQSNELQVFAFLLSPVEQPEWFLRAATRNPEMVLGKPAWTFSFDAAVAPSGVTGPLLGAGRLVSGGILVGGRLAA